jgi:chemotaxis protein MotB
MLPTGWLSASTALLAAALFGGCTVVPSGDWNTLKTQNGTLQQENRAQAARLQNLEAHSRSVETKLRDTEQELAVLDEQQELSRQKLASYEFDRNQLSAQFQNVAGRWPVSPELSRRLADVARRYPQLRFDPQTGIAKLDTDILFDVGTSEIKPAAEETLRELVSLLKSPEAQDLKVMVVGHTDDQPVAKRPARDNFRDNFDLSSDRAVAVSEALERLGLPENRMGVAGFGAHQPVAPNITSTDRQKNRRVELFVLPPDVPVIGWTETIPSVY